MKRADIRAAVQKTLGPFGVDCRWNRCELLIVVAGRFREIRLPAGMSRRSLCFQLGRITGWIEMMEEIVAAGAERAAAFAAVNGGAGGEAPALRVRSATVLATGATA